MKKNIIHKTFIFGTVFTLLAMSAFALAQDDTLNLNTGGIQVHLSYPHEAKVNETIFIKWNIVPKNFATRNAMSVKFSSKKNSEADYVVNGTYPQARATFFKPGTYALEVNTGLLVGDG